MTPAARVQAAIDILTALGKTDQPADRLLKDYFRARRYAGSKDRAAVIERVFQVLRHRVSLAWTMDSDSPRALALAQVALAGEDPDILFTGHAYAPAPLTEAEQRQLRASRTDPPPHVEGEFPAFLEAELTRAFGDDLLREMTAFLDRAPTDLRVNTLKAARDDVLRILKEQGFDAAPTPHSPLGIRIATGGAGLDRTRAFVGGLFEFQDEAAQIASILVAPKPGERILDLAAGAGGKSLALAALSDNEATITASDIRASALEQLRLRASRAGARIEVIPPPERGRSARGSAPGGGPPIDPSPSELRSLDPPLSGEGNFDAVLLDAPCTGTGTWRRQPELRGRLTPSLLARRIAAQDELLDRAAALVKPGGRLIYATCSILPSENEDRVAAFRARHPAFAPESAAAIWSRETGAAPPRGMAQDFRATPYTTGTDGFFTAILARNAATPPTLDKGRA